MNFITELRRRNVIRMGGLYIVGAWLLIQIAETLLPIFKTPDWVLQTLVVLLALGFVPALVFSWVFELTPDGFRRERDLDHSQPVSDPTTRKLDVAIILLLLAGIGLLVWNRLHPATPAAGEAVAQAALGAQSIAVLPFASFSAAEEDALFADGLADTVLHKLAQLRQLRVIARNSSFVYKGSNVDVRRVGSELGVASVLEGSVQRQGERIRVIAQLIETASGSHLWSQTYDRPVADLFAIQDEIAAAVVKALEVELLAGEAQSLGAADAVDPRAQEQLLVARGHRETLLASASRSEQGGVPWRDAAREAVRIDPGFFDAWIELASAEQNLAFISADAVERQAAIDRGYTAVRRALMLRPDSTEALGVTSWLLLREGRNAESLALNLSMLERSPNSTASMRSAGISLWSLMRPAEALVLQDRALALDPLATAGTRQRGRSLILLGRLDEARANHLAGVERAPDFQPFYLDLALIEGALRGDWAASTRWLLRGIAALPDDRLLPQQLAEDLQLLGLDARAAHWAAIVAARSSPRARAGATANMRILQNRHAEALALVQETGYLQDERWLRDHRGELALNHLLADDVARARSELAVGLDELNGGLEGVFQIGTASELYRTALFGLVATRLGDQGIAGEGIDKAWPDQDLGPLLLRLALNKVRTQPAQGQWRGGTLMRHYSEAELLAALGEHAAALTALQQALPADDRLVLLNSLNGQYIADSPYLESLHAEPRYQTLMAEIERRRQAAAKRVAAVLADHESGAAP